MLRSLPTRFVLISFAMIFLSSMPVGGRDRPVTVRAILTANGSLIELSSAEIAALAFDDDGDHAPANISNTARPASDMLAADSIGAALHHSLTYYLTLPPETKFVFGPRPGDIYTVAEMVASCSFFLKIVRKTNAKLRTRELRRRFRVFESRNTSGKTLFTGYYTPRLNAARVARSPADVPIFGRPADHVQVDISRFVPDYSGPVINGRVHEGRLVKYFTQSEILSGKILDQSTALFYLNAADFYHLQLQGGALITFPKNISANGASTGTNDRSPAPAYYEYATDNGHDFQSPGKSFSAARSTLRRRATQDPKNFKTGLGANPRYIFFQEQSRGPSGSLKTPLTPGRSIAMDSNLIRGGVPAFVMTQSPERNLNRFAVVQDTGNAIRGHGRVDFYWGDDPTAERLATRFKQTGRVFLFVARK